MALERKSQKKALLVGIQYENDANGSSDDVANVLRGPHQDVAAMRNLLIGELRRVTTSRNTDELNIDCYGYSSDDIVVLVDSDDAGQIQPTRANMLQQIKQLVNGAQAGDHFFFHYAGHTVQVENTNNSEEDGMDECIIPSDGEAHLIKDDELRRHLVDVLPVGSNLVIWSISAVIGYMFPGYRKGQGELIRGGTLTLNQILVRKLALNELALNEVTEPSATIPPEIFSRHVYQNKRTSASNVRSRRTSIDKLLITSKDYKMKIRTKSLSLRSDSENWYEWPSSPPQRCPSPDAMWPCTGYCAPTSPKEANVISLAACKDDQLSWEDGNGASMTKALINILSNFHRTWLRANLKLNALIGANPHPTLRDLLSQVALYLGLHEHAREYRKQLKEVNRKRAAKGLLPLSPEKPEMDNFQDPQLPSVWHARVSKFQGQKLTVTYFDDAWTMLYEHRKEQSLLHCSAIYLSRIALKAIDYFLILAHPQTLFIPPERVKIPRRKLLNDHMRLRHLPKLGGVYSSIIAPLPWLHPNCRHAAPNPFTSPKKKALLIGICYRQDDEYLDLTLPWQDVDRLKDLLIKKYGYHEDHVIVMTDSFTVDERLRPTHENISRELQAFLAAQTLGDQYLFHYAGHSYQQASDDEGEEDGKDEFILPCDAYSNGKVVDEKKAIVDDFLKEYLVVPLLPENRLVAIFDSCHSATLLGNYKFTVFTKVHIFMICRPSASQCSNQSQGVAQYVEVFFSVFYIFLGVWLIENTVLEASWEFSLEDFLSTRPFQVSAAAIRHAKSSPRKFCGGYCRRSQAFGNVLCISACKDSQEILEEKEEHHLFVRYWWGSRLMLECSLVDIEEEENPSLKRLMRVISSKSQALIRQMKKEYNNYEKQPGKKFADPDPQLSSLYPLNWHRVPQLP
ncbi:hypothetical protein L208DRAFT_1377389 [Tricholoma matsutake]|nr:hypothetical protein L208DRAFT_1377389 [Tricholoma matsutake 945]